MKILELKEDAEEGFITTIYKEAGVLEKLENVEKVVKVEQILVFQNLMYIILEPMHCTLARLMGVLK